MNRILKLSSAIALAFAAAAYFSQVIYYSFFDMLDKDWFRMETLTTGPFNIIPFFLQKFIPAALALWFLLLGQREMKNSQISDKRVRIRLRILTIILYIAGLSGLFYITVFVGNETVLEKELSAAEAMIFMLIIGYRTLFNGFLSSDKKSHISTETALIVLAVVTLSFNTLSMGFVRGIKLLNSQAVCTVITKEGEAFDCLVFVGSSGQEFFYVKQTSMSGQPQYVSFFRESLKSVYTLKPDGTSSYQAF